MSLALVIVLCACLALRADSWFLPKKEIYCSANGRFCLEVIPRSLESALRYFEDKVNKKKNPGLPTNASEPFCRAVLFEKPEAGEQKILWKGRLVNEIAPVSALVSNDAAYMVTFDNWHRVGYGEDVVVVYKSTAEIVRKFSLEQILGNDVKRVDRSVSSRWWAGDDEYGHFVDEANGVLVLRAVLIPRKAQSEDDAREHREIRIVLRTGEIQEPQ